MVDRINPNRKNRLSPKEIAKQTAALTLLLSTIACSTDASDGGATAFQVTGVVVLLYLAKCGIEWFFFGGKEKFEEGKKREEERRNKPWEPPKDIYHQQ